MNSSLFIISLKSCLTISLVSSSHALTSSARIPWLSGDLPFLSLLIAVCNSSVVISGIPAVSPVLLLCTSVLLLFIIFTQFMFWFIFLCVFVKSFVEFTKDIGNSFPRCDAIPFSFFIFVMSTLFFADLIPVIFRTTLNSSRILWMSCCLCILFFFSDTFFKHLLTFFSRCFSSLDVLLLSSMSLRISASLIDKSSRTFAAADAITRASLLSFLISLVLLLEWNTIEPASSSWCGNRAPRRCVQDVLHLAGVVSAVAHRPASRSRRCSHYRKCKVKTSNRLDACARSKLILPVVLCSYCCSSCFFLRLLVLLLHLYFFDRVWALFQQSLSCRLVVFTVFSDVVDHTRYRRPPVLTSMLNQSWNTPLVCYCAAAFHASFNLVYFCFLECAISFCCCGVLSFDLCFCVLPCVMCFISFCGGGFFLLCQRFLGIFFRARAFQYWCFSAWSRSSYSIHSNHWMRLQCWIGTWKKERNVKVWANTLSTRVTKEVIGWKAGWCYMITPSSIRCSGGHLRNGRLSLLQDVWDTLKMPKPTTWSTGELTTDVSWLLSWSPCLGRTSISKI